MNPRSEWFSSSKVRGTSSETTRRVMAKPKTTSEKTVDPAHRGSAQPKAVFGNVFVEGLHLG
jgi:hypothetical protein